MGQMDFAGVLSHRGLLKPAGKRQSEGTDAALAALQNTLASYKQEKEAKAVNISSSIIAAPENRYKAAKQAQRRGYHDDSSAMGTPNLGAAPTSIPATDSAVRTKAMRTPLIHLLAMRPLTREEIVQKTRIPKDDLEEVLPKVGKQGDGKWQLTDRAYKELDVYKFGYRSQEDRQAAVDNAIRAYDRMRLGKDEKIWQMLLPKEERGKGIVLSKLHLGAGAAGRGLTPNYGASPMAGGESTEKGGVSASNTPRLGPSSTPKPSTGALSKTLFAKDPKKARLAEEAKERKRKDRETAASTSDREGGKPVRKKQVTKTNNPKVKSAELVQSSDEDSVSSGASKGASRLPKVPPNERKPLSNAASAAKTKSATPAISNTATSGNTSTAATKATKPKANPGATAKTATSKANPPSAKPSPSLSSTVRVTKPATIGRNTPSSSQQGRSQLSPQNRNSRPNVPSPLGAARPRTTSDVSNVGVQRVRPGAETPKGLGITNGFRKRQDTVTSNDSNASERTNGEQRKPNGNGIRKPTANGTNLSKAPMTNGNPQKAEGAKRKAADSVDDNRDNGVKHRKTESNSSQSQKSHSSSVGARSSIDEGRDRSDSSSSITDTITYRQGVGIARQFRDVYYPQYAKLYDEQAEKEKRGEEVPREERQRLWQLHRRLEQMKREIKAASLREDED